MPGAKSSVAIRGDGVAARCCAHLLSRAGFEVAASAAGRARLPAIMLNEAALGLLRDVFDEPGLFREVARIRKRIVMWGGDAAAVSLDHSGVVVSEEALLAELGNAEGAGGESEWTVYAASPLPGAVSERRFGSREAVAVPVELMAHAEPEACWMESVESGWLFLITDAPGSGWLLAVGAAPDALLGGSRLVAGQIARCGAASRAFAASPRMASPVCGPGWLACGTAAMAFDPICGDGTAHAVREAILASAVVRAGGDASPLLQHYESRLTAAFRKHLELCLRYYEAGAGGDWWRGEAAAARAGIDWCDGRLAGQPGFRYRLSGFELQPV